MNSVGGFCILFMLVNAQSEIELSINNVPPGNLLRADLGLLFKAEGTLRNTLNRLQIVVFLEPPTFDVLEVSRFTNLNCVRLRSYPNIKEFLPVCEAHELARESFLTEQRNLVSEINTDLKLQFLRYFKIYESIGLPTRRETSADLRDGEATDSRREKRALGILGAFSIVKEVVGVGLQIKNYFVNKRARQRQKRINADLYNKIQRLGKDFALFGVLDAQQKREIWTQIKELKGNLRDLGMSLDKTVMALHRIAEVVALGYRFEAMKQSELTYMRRMMVLMRKYAEETRRFVTGLIRMSRGYLDPDVITLADLNLIAEKADELIASEFPDYKFALDSVHQMYDMKLVTMEVDTETKRIMISFPILLEPSNAKPKLLYSIETVNVPITDKNKEARSFTRIVMEKPYIAANDEFYIQLTTPELRYCKMIENNYYCEDRFLVKHRTKHTCESATFYLASDQDIKDYCSFEYSYNKTVIPSILDRQHGRLLLVIRELRQRRVDFFACMVGNDGGCCISHDVWIAVPAA